MSEMVLDQWQIVLKQKRIEVEECQKTLLLTSCLKCSKLIEC
jgi:hypothetical protein